MRSADAHPLPAGDAHALPAAEVHAQLAATDTVLPSLPALLDDSVLAERLGAPVSRSYLRYKPGTSAIALVDVDGRSAIASVSRPDNGDKRAKALKDIAAEDVLLDAPVEGLLVVDALVDRKLAALRLLVRSGRIGPWLGRLGHPVAADAVPTTLAHKPARRWVGRIPLEHPGRHIVLRVYTRAGHEAALAAHGLIDPAACPSVRLPRVLGTHRRGLIALEHLPGHTLDESLPDAALRRLGACLGELHASGPSVAIAGEQPQTTDGLEVLAPVLGDLPTRARAVDAAARATLRPGPGGVIHGDFSLDQVVADGHSLGIIDLDRVRIGNPVDDIASLLAVAALNRLRTGGAGEAAALMDRLRAPFVAGHSSTWTSDLSDDLGPRTALALLARAVEPFRSGHDTWPEMTHQLVTLAEQVGASQVAA